MTNKPLDEEAIFKIACKISDLEARTGYLQQICRDYQALYDRVSALLRARDEQPSFLESPPSALQPTIDAPESPARLGEQIGPYKLLQVIGEGGMGVVYMAEQSHPVKRRVALKVIKPGMDSRQVIARFDAERQALAMMDHPNIARVLEAGTTAATDAGYPGRPYFVMELVRGLPITEYCDQHQLSTRERLDLFVQVCQAVQHAHQKGVIHRDIKPSNVLVADYDDRPVPKVIDFGLAKAVSVSLTEMTNFTRLGQVVGTFEYMSPEQAKFNQLDVDTRTDIYSLGVLLYELLTGGTPFDRQRLHSAALDEMLRIIREEEPPKPSTRISSWGQTADSLSAQRKTDLHKLLKLVRGDLDLIVMKSLEKDRARRYETASALAADVERYLHDEQVLASPPSTAYRLKKTIRRHRGPVIAVSALVLSLMGGIIGTTVGMRKAWDEADNADRARLESESFAHKEQNARTELQTRMEQLRNQTLNIAQNAALLGDVEGVQTAMQVLDDDSISQGQKLMIDGLLDFTRGHLDSAYQKFRQLRILEPSNYIAQALITKLTIDVAADGDFPKELARLNRLTPRNDDERVMLAVTKIYTDPYRALELIDSSRSQSHWIVKLLIRAEARMTIAGLTASVELNEQALHDVDALQLVIGPNLNNRFVRLLGLAYAMRLHRNQGNSELATRYQNLAESESSKILQEYPDDFRTHWSRYYFFRFRPDSRAAWESLKLIGAKGSNSIFAAFDRLQNQPDARLALKEFDEAVPNAATNDYTKLARAYLLTRLTGREHEIAAIANELSQHHTLMLQQGAIHLYCMLGNLQAVRELAGKILKEHDEDDFIKLWNERKCLQAFENPELLPKLLAESENNPMYKAKARYTAALIRLCEGQTDDARHEFEQVVQTTMAWTFPEDAEALLACISRDKEWPRCRQVTSEK